MILKLKKISIIIYKNLNKNNYNFSFIYNDEKNKNDDNMIKLICIMNI